MRHHEGSPLSASDIDGQGRLCGHRAEDVAASGQRPRLGPASLAGRTKLDGPIGRGRTRCGWVVPQCGINRPPIVQIVAYAPNGVCLARLVRPLEFVAPASALLALTKMPCRWHCQHQWQDGGIHRPAAGNVLESLVSSLPTGASLLRSGTQEL